MKAYKLTFKYMDNVDVAYFDSICEAHDFIDAYKPNVFNLYELINESYAHIEYGENK